MVPGNYLASPPFGVLTLDNPCRDVGCHPILFEPSLPDPARQRCGGDFRSFLIGNSNILPLIVHPTPSAFNSPASRQQISAQTRVCRGCFFIRSPSRRQGLMWWFAGDKLRVVLEMREFWRRHRWRGPKTESPEETRSRPGLPPQLLRFLLFQTFPLLFCFPLSSLVSLFFARSTRVH